MAKKCDTCQYPKMVPYQDIQWVSDGFGTPWHQELVAEGYTRICGLYSINNATRVAEDGSCPNYRRKEIDDG